MSDLSVLETAFDPDPRHEAAPGDRAAAVLALIVERPVPALLFTERAAAMSRHPGEVSFPGGLRDPADTTLAATALRETEEEVGIAPSDVRLLGALEPIHTFVSAILVTPFIGVVADLPALTVSTAEIERAFTIAVSVLAAAEERRVLHRDERGVVFGWWYETPEAVVWGATGSMVHALLEVLAKETPWMMS